jgi:pimeloyl-ACP methyl ester carboxylesterase
MASPQKLVSFKNLAKLFLLGLLVLYVAICVIMAVIQRSLIYYPHVYSPAQADERGKTAGLERWTNSAGTNIGFKRRAPRQPAEGSILLAYGNGSTATGSAKYATDIQKAAAMDVYILEYPGYEDRPGPATEKNLFAAAADAFEMIPTNAPVYLIGVSLGSGVASYLAGTFTNRVAGIVLISPFTSVSDVGQHRYPILPVSLLVVDSFPSEDYLRNYHGKVGVSVDGKDVVVPEKFGLRLYNDYDGPKKLWEFEDGGHCQIQEQPVSFWKEAITFWQNN